VTFAGSEQKGRITNDQTRFRTFLARGDGGGQLQHDNNNV